MITTNSISPQKRRAYLANLLNAISVICGRKEEMLHESLSNFVTKVFNVMGIFAFENETKSLLKGFLSNLAASSPIIRRCAANCITTIISTNRKLDILLVLVVEYLTGKSVNILPTWFSIGGDDYEFFFQIKSFFLRRLQ